MAKKVNDRLAKGELQLLEMLWREGPVSLSQAHAALGLPIGYTTVQTRLNRLVDKGVVKKSDGRPAMYESAVTQEAIAQNDLELLLKRVSNGEVVPLVAHLVQDRKLSASEIDAIRNLIDNAEVAMLGKAGSERIVKPARKRIPAKSIQRKSKKRTKNGDDKR